MKQLDYSPLSQPVTFADAKPYIKSPVPFTSTTIFALGFVGLLVFGTMAFSGAPAQAYFICILVFGSVMTLFYVITRSAARDMVKLVRFAVHNNLIPTFDVDEPGLSGLYFDQGYDKKLLASLDIPEEGITLGHYQYTTGGGKSRQVHKVGYARKKLSRQLPHIVLDNKHNNFWKMTNLPEYFSASQKLSLEGDFDKHFTLYAPKEYERDALYIFTPDVMANFIDNGFDFDAEIIDNNLYVYSETTFFANEKFLSTAYAAIHSLGGKIEQQSDYYMDERVMSRAANVVAPQGRRLKSRFGILAVGSVLFVVVINVFNFVANSISTHKIDTSTVPVFMLIMVIFTVDMMRRFFKRNK